ACGAGLSRPRGAARAPEPRDDPPPPSGWQSVPGLAVPDAPPAQERRARRERPRLVLPARRLDVRRLMGLGPARDAGGPRRRGRLQRGARTARPTRRVAGGA